MKINAVHLASFGKFKDYTLNFDDGFNVIFGENEKGKSTVMAFIRMMFYGTSGKSADIDKNLRKKYMPFDSDLMAGSIDFTYKGVPYTLERIFKASNSTDKIKLINRATGESEAVSGKTDIGFRFFGIGDAAFEKSVYIGNLSVSVANEVADGELNSKLSNIVSSADEDISLEKVSARLLKAKEALMSRSGRIGIYDKAKRELEAAEEEQSSAQKREADIRLTEEKIAEKQGELAAVAAESSRLFDLLKNAKKLNLKASLERYFAAAEAIESLEEKIKLQNGKMADKEYLDTLKAELAKTEECQKTVERLSLEAEKTLAALEGLKTAKDEDVSYQKQEKIALEKELESLRKNQALLLAETEAVSSAKASMKPSVKPNIALIIVGAVLTLSGIGLGFINKLLFLVAAAGLIILLLGFIIKKKVLPDSSALDKKEELLEAEIKKAEHEELALSKKIAGLDEAINASLVESGSRKALLQSKTAEYLEQRNELLVAKEDYSAAKAQLLSLAALLEATDSSEDIKRLILKAEDTLSQIEAQKVRLGLAYEATGCSSREEAASRLAEINTDEKLSGMSAEELENAQRKLREISEEKNLLSSEVAALMQELKNLSAQGETVPVLEQKILKIKAKLKSQKAFCDSTDLAMQVLSEAFGELRHGFGGVIEQKTAELFAALTGGAYTAVNVSKSFDIGVTAKDSFGTKEWQYLSTGTAEQVYFALRLALASLIGEEASPLPLLLDDSFSEYDDKRAEKAIKFLQEYSDIHQIIFFTCHSGLANMAKKLDTDIKNL